MDGWLAGLLNSCPIPQSGKSVYKWEPMNTYVHNQTVDVIGALELQKSVADGAVAEAEMMILYDNTGRFVDKYCKSHPPDLPVLSNTQGIYFRRHGWTIDFESIHARLDELNLPNGKLEKVPSTGLVHPDIDGGRKVHPEALSYFLFNPELDQEWSDVEPIPIPAAVETFVRADAPQRSTPQMFGLLPPPGLLHPTP